MRRIFIFSGIFWSVWSLAQPQNVRVSLQAPIHSLFSHRAHQAAFNSLDLSCTECHNFSVRDTTEQGPTARQIKEKVLKPKREICHQCHLGNVLLPRPNQCEVCHSNVESLKPQNHFSGWRLRHGSLAQLDQDSCRECHAKQACNDCHVKRDTMNPIVHRPNFRLTHSVQARIDPQRCTTCHRSASFCVSCHTGERR